jgi:hypothetical protein
VHRGKVEAKNFVLYMGHLQGAKGASGATGSHEEREVAQSEANTFGSVGSVGYGGYDRGYGHAGVRAGTRLWALRTSDWSSAPIWRA